MPEWSGSTLVAKKQRRKCGDPTSATKWQPAIAAAILRRQREWSRMHLWLHDCRGLHFLCLIKSKAVSFDIDCITADRDMSVSYKYKNFLPQEIPSKNKQNKQVSSYGQQINLFFNRCTLMPTLHRGLHSSLDDKRTRLSLSLLICITRLPGKLLLNPFLTKEIKKREERWISCSGCLLLLWV